MNFNNGFRITGNDAAADDSFGNSVALNSAGNIALVGAYLKNSWQGAAYIFTGSGNNWLQSIKLIGTGSSFDNPQFGNSVSLNSLGNVALVGSRGEKSNGLSAGAVYIFTGSNGSNFLRSTIITGADSTAGDVFGYSVSLNSNGNIALVGAASDDIGALGNAGSAYIFTGSGSNWVQTAKITASNLVANDRFGYNVSLNSIGNIALIGTRSLDGNSATGAAYIFTGSGNNWNQVARLTGSPHPLPPNGYNDYFSESISINSVGDVAIIGAPNSNPNDGGGLPSGAAYIYTGSGTNWNQVARIVGNDTVLGDSFGQSVSLNSAGNIAGVRNRGSVYIFTGSGSSWSQVAKITGSDGFTDGVALNSVGNVALFGSSLTDLPGGKTDAGSAYIFTQKLNQTITFPPISDKGFGDPVFYLDASSDSNLPITYSSSNPSIASITGASGVKINNVGSVTITATQTGNSNYEAAVPISQSFNVFCDYIQSANAGGFYSLALLKDGRITGWGRNANGEIAIPLGIGTGALAISAGYEHSLAVLKDGRVTGWGYNADGQVNVPTGIGTGAAQVSAGLYHSLALLKDGRVTGWGRSTDGQINIPVDIGTGAAQVSAGQYHSLALLKDGRVTGWGQNDEGQTNIPVGIGTDAAQVSAGLYHSLALLKDGRITGWGRNFQGQVTIPISIGTGALAISAGGAHSLAVLKDGRVTGWGWNNFGQINIPAGIGTGAAQVSAGYQNSIALLKDGRVTGWGNNVYGQINIPLDINCSFTKFTPTITFPSIPTKTFGDTSFNLGVTSTNSALSITYTSSNTSVATVNSNGDVTIIGLGTTNITASQAGDSNYNAATPVSQTLTVNKADQIITFPAIPIKTFGDPLFYLAGTSTSNLPLTYSGNNSSVATILGSGVTIVGAGTCEITGYQTGNSNYNAATPVAQTLTVLRGSQTINLSGFYTGVYNETKTYDLSTPQGLPIIYTGNTNIFSIAANNITFINTGVTILTGYNTGSTNYTGITGTQQVTVNRANAIIDFPYIPTFNINVTSGYTLNATSNHSESAIEYTSSNSGAASISGTNTLLITGTGVGIITAYQPATSHYNEASGQRSFTALDLRNPQIVAVSNLPNNVFFDTGSKYLQGYLQDQGTYHLKLHILEDNILCEKTIVLNVINTGVKYLYKVNYPINIGFIKYNAPQRLGL
jgi:alpha-tubulin suppressor-like RCC1 family protein